MNWGWVVSASTLRWWLLKTLPFAWKLLSATNTMPDFCHESFKVSKYGVYPRLSRWPKGQFGRRRLHRQQCFLPSDSIVFAYVTLIKYTYLLTYYKVNRCLARYSPRATTTNQMSRQGLAQIDQKCQFWAKFGRFWAKNPFFYWRNQKFCYPHNGKPT